MACVGEVDDAAGVVAAVVVVVVGTGVFVVQWFTLIVPVSIGATETGPGVGIVLTVWSASAASVDGWEGRPATTCSRPGSGPPVEDCTVSGSFAVLLLAVPDASTP